MDLISEIVDKPDVFQISLPKVEGAEAFLDDIVKRNTVKCDILPYGTDFIFDAVRVEGEIIEVYGHTFDKSLGGEGLGSVVITESNHIISKNLKTGKEERDIFKYYDAQHDYLFDGFFTFLTAGLYPLGGYILDNIFESRRERRVERRRLCLTYDKKVKEYKAKNLKEAQETTRNFPVYQEPLKVVEKKIDKKLSVYLELVPRGRVLDELRFKTYAYLLGADAAVNCCPSYTQGTLVKFCEN